MLTNNSDVLIATINDSNALLCNTDLRPCCRQDGTGDAKLLMGEWYYPNGTQVDGREGGEVFFRTRGLNDGTVNLFQKSSGVSPVGLYCCEIPNMNMTNQTLCATLGEY